MTHYLRRRCDGCGKRIARSRPDGGDTYVRSRHTGATFCRDCAINGLPPKAKRPTREELEMATTETEKTTTKEPVAPGSNWVRDADSNEEAILEEKVRPLFSDEKIQGAAMRYGRKLLRKAAGKRASAPPLTGLTYDQAVSVANALGVEAPQKRERAATKTKKESGSKQAKPDPKPSARKKTSAAS